MHTCTHLSTLYTQLYWVRKAINEYARAIDTCSAVENRNEGWYFTLAVLTVYNGI